MADVIGKSAVVIGAGMGGMLAAASIAKYFAHVFIIEQDELPSKVLDRRRVPQGKHIHQILAGGLNAMFSILPNLESDLQSSEAVPLHFGWDTRIEFSDGSIFPQRKLGIYTYGLSRALLEYLVRQNLGEIRNIETITNTRVVDFVHHPDSHNVTGVLCRSERTYTRTIKADLVIDASGNHSLLKTYFKRNNIPAPRLESVGCKIGYTSAIINRDADANEDWKMVVCIRGSENGARGAALLPINSHQSIVTLVGAHGHYPPTDQGEYIEFARGLATPTVFEVLESCKFASRPTAFRFPASHRCHFGEMELFPSGVLPLGDSICRFNPVFGQGISVAALEAVRLRRLIESNLRNSDPLGCLAKPYFSEVDKLVNRPWTTSAILDFENPRTSGDRPHNLADLLDLEAKIFEFSAENLTNHKLVYEVRHMLRPLDQSLIEKVERHFSRAQKSE